jgi:hypothetical protein
MRKRGPVQQDLEGGQKQHAAQHAGIVARTAGDKGTTDDDHRD